MPTQAPWTEFLSCPICYNVFGETHHRPISLGCGHTVCKVCLEKLPQKKCPFDQNPISREIDELPVNFALLQLVGVAVPENAEATLAADSLAENFRFYNAAKRCIEELAIYLKPMPQNAQAGPSPAPASVAPALSRPMQRKLVTLVNCQLVEEEGRARAMRAARSLAERTVTELILQHQNPQQLSANLWAAVRARGCQFLGPAMQEEVLKLILLALEDGSALSRKVLVLFAVQRLESQYTQASKTAVGHVVQLLYRASCFKVTKREEESSLMQLKDEFRTYELLRREHDSQIIQIATEAGLRISPEQWSSLLYGDAAHKSHMQSIIDKLQTPQSFAQSVDELMIALQRLGDPGNLGRLKLHFDLLSNIDPSPDVPPPSWENLEAVMRSVLTVVQGLIEFINARNSGKADPVAPHNTKFKTSMCRDLVQKGRCPRGSTCTFAHSQEEMDRFRNQSRRYGVKPNKAGMSENDLDMDLDELTLLEDPMDAEEMHSRWTPATNEASNVLVPVGKPSVMPAQAKKSIAQQTIYTSPTLTIEDYGPSPVPISQQAPHPLYKMEDTSQNSQTAISQAGPVYALSVGSESASSGTRAPVRPQISMETCQQHRMSVPDNFMHHTMALPPNPYTHTRIALPTKDSQYYLKGNVSGANRGQTASQQLQELQRRKFDLIAQLQKTHNPASMFAPQPVSQPRQVTSRVTRPQNYADLSLALGMSVADSLATTHTTMAVNKNNLANHGHYDWPRVPLCKEEQQPLYNTFGSMPNYTSEPHVHQASTVMCSMVDTSPDMSTSVQNMGTVLSSAKPHSFPRRVAVSSTDSENSQSNVYPSISNTSSVMEEEDEFIPFEHTVVSKYGPISRMARTKLRDTGPVQVQAIQPKDTTPVTVVTPLERPFPNSFQVPSRYSRQMPQVSAQNNGLEKGDTTQYSEERQHRMNYIRHPQGLMVATSLPTAMLMPNVVSSGTTVKPNTLWALREKVLNLPGLNKPAAQSTAEREQIRHELTQLHRKIEGLKSSEDQRLAQELQAVEMHIQETQRQLSLSHSEELPHKAKDGSAADSIQGDTAAQMQATAQEKAIQVAKQKRVQEEEDRKLAEKLVLEEARDIMATNA